MIPHENFLTTKYFQTMVCYTSSIVKTCPNPKLTDDVIMMPIVIVRGYFNIFIMFQNVSMTYPIVVILIMRLIVQLLYKLNSYSH